jgi:DNA modification methylase
VRIKQRKVAELLPYVNNARTHSDEQISKVAASIKEFGFNNPILLDGDRTIIAGHARLAAARKLDLDTVPCIELAHLSDAQRKAYILADNRLAEHAGWDMDLLRIELDDLEGMGVDLDLLGFDASFTAGRGEGLTDEDEVPEPAAVAVSQTGDLWRLGEHRLLCGDAANKGDVHTILGDCTPHLMVTDPPYGVNFDPTWRDGSEGRTYIEPKQDVEWVWKDVWALFPGDVIYIWHGANKAMLLYKALHELKFEFRAQIIWNKMRFIIGRGHYCWNHEPCFYGVRKTKTAHWSGGRNQPTVWDIKHRASDTNHGAQKPVECMRRPIENSSAPGDAVYDPFVGSGTTIIAAETTGRRCLAVEINPLYCDIVIRRWQDFTGQTAVLDGKSFDQVTAERANGKAGRQTKTEGAARLAGQPEQEAAAADA